MSGMTYYQRNRDVMLNRAKDYCENDKERLREKEEISIETYLKKIRIKKNNMEKNRYYNMFEEKKSKTKRIPKKISRGKKSKHNDE